LKSEALEIEQTSIYSKQSKNYNPFYHPTQESQMGSTKMSAADLLEKQKHERKMLQEHKEKLIDEWGFQNEETRKMFEARMNNKNKKKKKVLSAEEKYKRFLMIKNKLNH
jgi:hypothetical protein